jgi:cytochrome c-type biogenesis protein CcmH/NrfG
MTEQTQQTDATGDTRRTDLESEREFLLRSLDDLEAEREAGNIDDATYQSLHDDYTARAATVLRSLRDGVAPTLPEAPRSSQRMKIVTAVALVAFAAFAAVGLARALGTREEGQTITGNDQTDAGGLADLRRAADERPDDYDARVAYARALLGNDLAESLKQFDAASKIDPSKPEPYTYIGWIDALAARQLPQGADRDALVNRAVTSLDTAVARDPNYYDAYVYRALTKMNLLGDPAAAVPDFQRFLALAPADHPQRELVNGALAEALKGTTPSTVASP